MLEGLILKSIDSRKDIRILREKFKLSALEINLILRKYRNKGYIKLVRRISDEFDPQTEIKKNT